MSLSSPIKIHKLTGKNKLDSIIVFWGTNLEISNPTTLFNEFIRPDSNKEDAKYKIITDLFPKLGELTNIIANNVPVTFTNQTIHIDDNIGTIKLKIFEATGRQTSIDEMYMFCLKSEKLNPISFYQTLTQNDRIPLTRIRLNQMLSNIYKPDGTLLTFDIPSKDKYSFDDILKLNLSQNEYLVSKALGQKFIFLSEYPFVVDPFLVTSYDHLLERSRKELSSLNNNLLLESEVIADNTLYICLAEDVFKHMETNKLSGDYASKIYFPFLHKLSIDTLAKLESNREKLVKNTSDKLTKNTERIFENINMFYDVYNNKQPSQQFEHILSKTGITGIKIVLYPEYKLKIPIDVIFKLLHANNDYPLIKLNQDPKMENIYRLYTDKLTKDGRKIPAIINPDMYKDTPIFKLTKQIGLKKSVAIYTRVFYQIDETYDSKKEETDFQMICEFDENGHIMIYSFKPFTKPVIIGDISAPNFTHIDRIIELTVNQLIEQIKPFFEQSGLEIPVFKSIQSSNIEIRNITYQTVYSIKENIDLDHYSGCLSSIFTIENSDLSKDRGKDGEKGAMLRFKRVSNFTVLDSQVAFIIEKIDQGLNQQEIITELQKNYDDVTDEQAIDILQKTIQDLELTRGSKRRRSIMIKINPGFKTNMYTQTELLGNRKPELVVSVSGINDLYYLYTFPIYIDTFVRITQDITSTSLDQEIITKLCSGEAIEELTFNEIIAQSEQVPVAVPDNESNLLDFSDSSSIQSNNSLLDMLGFEEEDLDSQGSGINNENISSDYLKGGQGSSSDEEGKSTLKIDKKTKAKATAPAAKATAPAAKATAPAAKATAPRDISGMKLKYPNPFSKQIEDKMPHLFVKSKDDKIDLYTRMCPFSLAARRQPIILTKKEKEDLVNDHPEHYKDADGNVKDSEFIEYGTDPNDKANKFFFTCPRYWCLLTNTMVTKEDIMSGKCGPKPAKLEDAIIPQKADVVPKDKYVYQFYDENAPNNYPGFHKENLPDGTCIPCCYSKWSTTEMKKRRNTCQGKVSEGDLLDSKSKANPQSKSKSKSPKNPVLASQAISSAKSVKKSTLLDANSDVILEEPIVAEAEEQEEAEEEQDVEIEHGVKGIEGYVKGPEKYPLHIHRWGFLPIVVQKFLHEVNSDCQISKTNMNLKPNHTCLLRHGVENNSKQSFIACIAMTMFYGQYYYAEDPDNPGQNKKTPLIKKFRNDATIDVPTINVMKEIIIEAIDIDKFITYQNGDLITSFANPENMEKQVKPEFIHQIKQGNEWGEEKGEEEGEGEEGEGEEGEEVYEEPNKKFIKGEKIECNYRGLDKKFIGTIVSVNRNNTYDIAYDKIHVNMDDYKDSELYKKINKKRKKNTLYRIKPSIEDDEDKETKYDDYTHEHEEFDFLIKVAEAFENFKRFLSDKTVYIDYTYLWDIICIPNPKLFENGLNLIVLEIPEDDVSNNVELACPTNQYSNNIYDVRRRSLFLIKREKKGRRGKWFEPIYAFHNRDSKSVKPKLTSTFTEYDRELPSTLRSVFSKIIKPTLGQRCKPLASQPYEYKFKTAPLLDNLITKLNERNYDIDKQVLNFQGKVIGVLAFSPKQQREQQKSQGKQSQVKQKAKGHGFFIPCYPSSLTSLKNPETKLKYEYVFMTDDIWHSYEDTLAFLKEYYKYKEPDDITKANCFDDRYFCKVADSDMDGTLIVGFLTNTNQFIQINRPKEISLIDDNIKTFSSNDTLTANINTQVSNRVDDRRVDFIKRIQLETNFYNIFRNTIRIMFNDYSNSEMRKNIQKECNKEKVLYREKLKRVVKMLKHLVKNDNDSNSIDATNSSDNEDEDDDVNSIIQFVEPFNYKNLNEYELQSCITNKPATCIDNITSICKVSSSNDKCVVTFPANNLITQKSNKEYYFNRLADELIRYNRIKSFIFKPQAYLSFGQVKYNLRDNEIILLENIMTQEFFDSLIPSEINAYARNNTYDNTEPSISIKHNHEVTMDEIINPYHGKECVSTEPTKIKVKHWKTCFPNFKEKIYANSRFCAFYVIIDLVKKIKQIDITIDEIKDDLIQEYNRLIIQNDPESGENVNLDRKHKIFDILKDEGQRDANQLIEGINVLTYEQMIIQYGFNIVNFDMWLLLNKYKIPAIFISLSELQETNLKRNEFVCYKTPDMNIDDQYVFIIVPSMYKRKITVIPEYKILMNEDDNELITVSSLVETANQCKRNIINAIEQYYTVEDFLDNIFNKQLLKKYGNADADVDVEKPAINRQRKTKQIISELKTVAENPNIFDIKGDGSKGGSHPHNKSRGLKKKNRHNVTKKA
jgi:hypothetical protein